MMKLTENIWTQIDGDRNPGAYGGTIARMCGDCIEVRKIQPTREYLGYSEAAEAGVPFWTRDGYYCPDDLDENRPEVQAAMAFVGTERSDLDGLHPRTALAILASACLDYGHMAEEGPSGFARDILGRDRVRWHATERAQGWRFLADEDSCFRDMVRDMRKRHA